MEQKLFHFSICSITLSTISSSAYGDVETLLACIVQRARRLTLYNLLRCVLVYYNFYFLFREINLARTQIPRFVFTHRDGLGALSYITHV